MQSHACQQLLASKQFELTPASCSRLNSEVQYKSFKKHMRVLKKRGVALIGYVMTLIQTGVEPDDVRRYKHAAKRLCYLFSAQYHYFRAIYQPSVDSYNLLGAV